MLTRIMARLGSEQDREKILACFSNVDLKKPGLVIGEVAEEELHKLTELGVPVQQLRTKLIEEVLDVGTEALEAMANPLLEAAEEEPDVYKIEFLIPLIDECDRALGKLGVRLLHRVTVPVAQRSIQDRSEGKVPVRRPRYFTARLTSLQVKGLSALPFIGSITRYTEEETLPDPAVVPSRRPQASALESMAGAMDLTRTIKSRGATPLMRGLESAGLESASAADAGTDLEASMQRAEPAGQEYEILLHGPECMGSAISALRKLELPISSAVGRKIRVRMSEEQVRQVATLPQAAEVEAYLPTELHVDIARQLVGVDHFSQATQAWVPLAQTGAGQRVGVADTGIDDQHPDLRNRIVGLVARGRPGDTSDPNGHGTHVAGCIAGDGTASNGAICGVAPKAELFIQSLLDASGSIDGGLPDDLADLFSEAYRNGVRIHNNSWGDNARSRYRVKSEELDRFVKAHPDMLIICSAGNYGSANSPTHVQKGLVDWYSISAPGTNKNGLTVGASRTSRSSGPSAAITHLLWLGATLFPASVPLLKGCVANEPIAGNPEGLFGTSSRGPSIDNRVKPDLVAPGTDILSTYSSQAKSAANPPFWGPYTNASYAYAGGTSMAAPIVSGCAALIREYYVSDCQHDPSAALLKATLINSTQWLTGDDAVLGHPTDGNIHQGFGRLYMPHAIPGTAVPWLQHAFADNWNNQSRKLATTGDLHRFQVRIGPGPVPQGSFLRVCLAYTDRPGKSVHNNINLTVELPNGINRYGNDHAYHQNPLLFDPHLGDEENNVEVVRIVEADLRPGKVYEIRIEASELMDKPHDYAFVVTGYLDPATTGRLSPLPP